MTDQLNDLETKLAWALTCIRLYANADAHALAADGGALARETLLKLTGPSASPQATVASKAPGSLHKKGLVDLLGKWPGDETDEEVFKALEELK